MENFAGGSGHESRHKIKHCILFNNFRYDYNGGFNFYKLKHY